MGAARGAPADASFFGPRRNTYQHSANLPRHDSAFQRFLAWPSCPIIDTW